MNVVAIRLIEMGYKLTKDVNSGYIYAKKSVNSLTENYIKFFENLIVDYYTYSKVSHFKKEQLNFTNEAINLLYEDVQKIEKLLHEREK